MYTSKETYLKEKNTLNYIKIRNAFCGKNK